MQLQTKAKIPASQPPRQSPRAILPRPQTLKTLDYPLGMSVSSENKMWWPIKVSGRGLKAGIVRYPPPHLHSCHGITHYWQNDPKGLRKKKALQTNPSLGAVLPLLLPNVVSFPILPSSTPYTVPPFYFLQSTYSLSEILLSISLLLVVALPPRILVLPRTGQPHNVQCLAPPVAQL